MVATALAALTILSCKGMEASRSPKDAALEFNAPPYPPNCTDANACFKKGTDYFNGTGGLDKDDTMAATHWRRACDFDLSDGCEGAGLMYEKGLGVPTDERKSSQLLEKAIELRQPLCEEGKSNECFKLGRMYFLGRGVEQDKAKAASLYRDSCDGGTLVACVDLEVMCNKFGYPACLQ